MKRRRMLAVPIICLLALLLLVSCNKEVPAPETYEIDGESIPSFSKGLGEGETANLASEDLPKDSGESADAQFVYYYDSLASGGKAAEEYAALLTGEDVGFLVVDENNTPTEDAPDYTAEEGTVLLAKTATTQGKILQVQIFWKAAECDVTVTRPEGKIAPKQVEAMTLPQAIQFLEGLKPTVLGLEGDSMSAYRVYVTDGRVLVNGVPCVRLQVYRNHLPEGSNAIAGSYLLTGDKQHLYRQEKSGAVVELQLS